MGLTVELPRRDFLTLIVTLLAFSCGRPTPLLPAPGDQITPAFRPVRRRPGISLILTFMPDTPQAHGAWQALFSELSPDFDVTARRIEKNSHVNDIAVAIRELEPSCLVLMNNPTVRLYKEFQRSQPRGTVFPPAVIVMASFVQEASRDLQQVTGIAYEVSGVIQFVKLRSIVKTPVTRIGVVYREGFDEYIAHEQKLADKEQITIVSRQVPRQAAVQDISRALGDLLEKERVNAVWVINDNALLTQEMIVSAWAPRLTLVPVPVIVSVPSLIGVNHPLGSFAMLPDHVALAVQAADLIFELAEGGWATSLPSIEFPVSIKTVVDVRRARRFWGLRRGALARIDQVLE